MIQRFICNSKTKRLSFYIGMNLWIGFFSVLVNSTHCSFVLSLFCFFRGGISVIHYLKQLLTTVHIVYPVTSFQDIVQFHPSVESVNRRTPWMNVNVMMMFDRCPNDGYVLQHHSRRKSPDERFSFKGYYRLMIHNFSFSVLIMLNDDYKVVVSFIHRFYRGGGNGLKQKVLTCKNKTLYLYFLTRSSSQSPLE